MKGEEEKGDPQRTNEKRGQSLVKAKTVQTRKLFEKGKEREGKKNVKIEGKREPISSRARPKNDKKKNHTGMTRQPERGVVTEKKKPYRIRGEQGGHWWGVSVQTRGKIQPT